MADQPGYSMKHSKHPVLNGVVVVWYEKKKDNKSAHVVMGRGSGKRSQNSFGLRDLVEESGKKV
jgi:hypothetical protein